MLVIFQVGPKGSQTLDVIDVIPRSKEALVKTRGLGKKATRFFWVEVKDSTLSDEQFSELAEDLVSPEIELTTPLQDPSYVLKPPPPKQRVVAKRKYRLNQKELEKLDSAFSASSSTRTLDASKLYPQKRINLSQLKKIIRHKKTGRNLNGD